MTSKRVDNPFTRLLVYLSTRLLFTNIILFFLTMKTNPHKTFVLLFLLCMGLGAQAQKQLKSHLNYIEKYKKIAIEHMGKYKIPASITLAQALLESGAGLSELAVSSNNHFGIKCHSDWKGERIYRRDDNPNDCFRKYTIIG